MAEPFDSLDSARDQAKQGRNFAIQAIQAAEICDEGKAGRMTALATPHLDRADRILQGIPAAQLAQMHYDDAIRRVVASGRGYLAQVAAALARCGQGTPIYEYVTGGGTFTAVEDGDSNSDLNRNQIKIVVELTGRIPCEEILFIATYHIENEATGETMVPPSKGDNRFDGDDPITEPPDDADAVDGHVVDAGKGAAKPGWFHDTDGNKITVYDRPAFVKRGFIAYFETCVVCVTSPPPKILGCVTWTYSGTTGKAEITNAQPGPPSVPFQRALWRWYWRRR